MIASLKKGSEVVFTSINFRRRRRNPPSSRRRKSFSR